MSINVFGLHKARRSTDIEGLKQWKGRPGEEEGGTRRKTWTEISFLLFRFLSFNFSVFLYFFLCFLPPCLLSFVHFLLFYFPIFLLSFFPSFLVFLLSFFPSFLSLLFFSSSSFFLLLLSLFSCFLSFFPFFPSFSLYSSFFFSLLSLLSLFLFPSFLSSYIRQSLRRSDHHSRFREMWDSKKEEEEEGCKRKEIREIFLEATRDRFCVTGDWVPLVFIWLGFWICLLGHVFLRAC